MTEIVSRTCSEIRESAEPGLSNRPVESRPLEQYREEPAYVLLGDPGAGKTTAFDQECAALGNDALLVSPRDLIHFEVADHPEWFGKTLFIDGLDEVRAGTSDARTPFDRIRQKLDALGKPRFRISCRQADWLGTNDLQNLSTVAPGGKVTLLQLDPLTKDDVLTILRSNPDIGDPESFVGEAEHRNIDGLLSNPNTLKLLMKAVIDGDWPGSRLQTFEFACAKLAAEQNSEHAVAAPLLPGDRLLEVAGRLSAVSLLTGIAGFALYESAADVDYAPLSQRVSDDPGACRQAVATRLFTAVGEGRFAFVHRHIAEFLSARYLAGTVEAGLPLRRVLALITGPDGTVVTTLRGLSAWLAAQCPRSRRELIERDPVGISLYGDLSTFTVEEKRSVLQSLTSVAPETLSGQEAAAFAPLVDPRLESTIRDVLTDPDRNARHQQLVCLLLQTMRGGVPLPRLAPICLDIVRDETREPTIGAAALDAYIHSYDGADKPAVLRVLLAHIVAGRVSDPSRDMMGKILTYLYPRNLPPEEAWDYLFERHERSSLYLGSYYGFWQFDLLRKSSDEQVCELLDQCRDRVESVRTALESHSMDTVLPELVARGLHACGDELDTARLYDWLGAGLPQSGLAGNRAAAKRIQDWLSERPDVQKAVVLEGLRRSSGSDAFHLNAMGVGERLYRARLPEDFESWCLEQALTLHGEFPRSSDFLVKQALMMHGLDAVTVRARLAGNRQLADLADRILTPPTESPEVAEFRRQDERHEAERRQREEEWVDYLRKQESALRGGFAAPSLLHELARKYFGSFDSVNPEEGSRRLAELVRDDLELKDAVFAGLKAVVQREDIPDFNEILRLHRQKRVHYLGLPFLASLAIAESDAPLDVSGWTRDRRREAVAHYLTIPHATYEPLWYRNLVEQHPEDLAEAQIGLTVPVLRKGRQAHYHLWNLAHDKRYAEVAQLASLPLLRAFPVRCGVEQLTVLNQLLWAAIANADRAKLKKLAARKLSNKSMGVFQRARWLAAGCLIAPETYRIHMADFAAQGRVEERVRHLLALFCSEHGVKILYGDLDVSTVELVVRLGGAHFGPEAWTQGGTVDLPMRASELVWNLVQRLAQDPTPQARDVLQSLLADHDLSRWRQAIEAAINEQRVVSRDANYRVPSLGQVLETLSGRNPSNAGDLAALVTELLRAIGQRIRTSNTDDWRQYWDDDSQYRPDRPKHENLCRDALLSDLRNELPPAVDAQPEGEYAQDRRADIRIACDDFHVPVEVKKNEHPDLWSALQNQLIKHYASDPATGGFGIYLVFWFGADRTQLAPSGKRPATPVELETRLLESLSEEERRRLSVCVIDVSRP